jgi:hypothetical protein
LILAIGGEDMTQILSGAPIWVYFLLIGLITLGVRRLKTRTVPVFVALIAPTAFLVWSLVGASSLASSYGTTFAASIWLVGATIGAVSGYLVPEPQGQKLPNRRVTLPATWMPLITYMTVFILRFACGAWAAIVPTQAFYAGAVAAAISAMMTARLIVAVLRWR